MVSERRHRDVLAAIGIISLAWILYSVLVLQRILIGVSVAIPLVVLYLSWRVVRAVERIADALEGNGSRDDPSP
jgi:hypothetical protein